MLVPLHLPHVKTIFATDEKICVITYHVCLLLHYYGARSENRHGPDRLFDNKHYANRTDNNRQR